MSRGGYTGGSTLISSRQLGRSVEEWEVTACSLFGADAFTDSREFLAYCELVDSIRVITEQYETVDDMDIANDVMTMLIEKMLELNVVERDKNSGLLDAIKRTRNYPHDFINGMMVASQEVEPTATIFGRG